jgi:transcriptional regulator with XRE-family HTH domain
MFMDMWTLNGSGEWVDKDGGIHIVETTLGEVIRARRKYIGMKQRDMAYKLRSDDGDYCSPQTLNNIEMGVRTGRAYWRSIAKVLGIPVYVLFYYGEMKGFMPQKSYAYHVIVDAIRAMSIHINMYERTYTPLEER